jgi:hypothetical protein
MKHKIASVYFVLCALVTSIVFLAACQKSTKPVAAFDVSAHRSEIQKWQSDRLASLTKNDGWLTLIGLF